MARWRPQVLVYALMAILASAVLYKFVADSHPVSAQSMTDTSILNQAISRGKIRVATTTSSPPFAFIDAHGDLVGFDIDIARLIAKSMFNDPNAVEFVRTSFDARWTTVNTDRADLGVMITTIQPSRALHVAFTDAYVDSGNGCLVKRQSNIHSFADINHPNITVALLNVEPDHQRYKEYYPHAKPLYFTTQAEQYAAVLSNQASAACTDRPFLAWVVKQHPDQLRLLSGTTSGVFNNAIFLKQGDFTWWLFLNTLVNEMKHGSLYTDYDAIYEKWLGEHAPPERYYGVR